MQQFVAVVNAHTLWTNHRKDLLAVLDTPGLTGVDLRWSLAGETGATQRNIAALQVARAARDRNLAVRMHGWVGSHNGIAPELAAAQAQQAAHICASEGVSAWGVNAEKDVWRHGRERAVAFLDAYLDRFYAVSRNTHAAYLGFVYPPLFYGKDVTIPDEHKRRYGQLWQMVYQTSASAVRSRLDLGQREWPHCQRNVYIGVGRIDAEGTVQGAWPVWFAERNNPTIAALTWYVGNGRAAEQLTVGNPRHPPLTVAIPQIAGLAKP